jgi:hypothetical protein
VMPAHAVFMRYAQGGELTVERRASRERLHIEMAGRFARATTSSASPVTCGSLSARFNGGGGWPPCSGCERTGLPPLRRYRAAPAAAYRSRRWPTASPADPPGRSTLPRADTRPDGRCPTSWPGGVRRRGGASLICCSRGERGMARPDTAVGPVGGGDREFLKRLKREGVSTVAGRAGGPARSSDDPPA